MFLGWFSLVVAVALVAGLPRDTYLNAVVAMGLGFFGIGTTLLIAGLSMATTEAQEKALKAYEDRLTDIAQTLRRIERLLERQADQPRDSDSPGSSGDVGLRLRELRLRSRPSQPSRCEHHRT